MTGQTITPKLAQAIVRAIEARQAELHTGLPAVVTAFDPESQSATVQPLLVRIVLDEDENEVEERMPAISNVPVLYPSFGPWVITSSLRPGNIVFLQFAERAIDVWLEADPGTEVDPKHSRMHDLSDAVCVPGLRPRTAPISGIGESLRIGKEGADPAIVLHEDGRIEIGEGATEPLILGQTLVSLLQALTVPTALGPSGPPINAGAMPSALSPLGRVK